MKFLLTTFLLFICIMVCHSSIDTITKNSLVKKEFVILTKPDYHTLKEDLLHFRIKEDYYTTALEEQANRFSLIVATVVGIIGLISFAGFKREVSMVKSEYKSQIEEVKKKLIGFNEFTIYAEISIKKATSNFYSNLGHDFIDESNFVSAFNSFFASARDRITIFNLINRLNNQKDYESDSKRSLELAILDLKHCDEALNKIIIDEIAITEFKKHYELIKFGTRELLECRKDSVYRLTSAIIIKLSPFFDEKFDLES